jgi:ADP-ribose pyrophosphatase YjhB (NUDIX family)
MEQLHYIQSLILTKLLYADELKFSEIKPIANIENNKLSFHLKRLVEAGLVLKTRSAYRLTNKGKEAANLLDDQNSKVIKQGKRSVVQCCIRNTGNEIEFLVYTRKKHPFLGMQGFPSGKVMFGEKVTEASKRELKEETNLEGEPDLVMIEHHLVYEKENKNLVEDKYFYFMRYMNPAGKLNSNSEGDFEWIAESKFEEFLKKPFESMARIVYIKNTVKNFVENITVSEIQHITSGF